MSKPIRIEDKCEDRLKMILESMRLVKTRNLTADLEEAIMQKDKKRFTEIALSAGIDESVVPALMNVAFDHKTMMAW